MPTTRKLPGVSARIDRALDDLTTLEEQISPTPANIALRLQAMQVRAMLLIASSLDELGDFAADSAKSLDYFTDHLNEVGQPA